MSMSPPTPTVVFIAIRPKVWTALTILSCRSEFIRLLILSEVVEKIADPGLCESRQDELIAF